MKNDGITQSSVSVMMSEYDYVKRFTGSAYERDLVTISLQ